MLKRFICFAFVSCVWSSAAFAQTEFDIPAGATITDEGRVEAIRFLNDGDVLLELENVDPATFNPSNCPTTDDGFRVVSGGVNQQSEGSSYQEVLLDSALALQGIRLIIGGGQNCDVLGRPIAITFDIDFDFGLLQ